MPLWTCDDSGCSKSMQSIVLDANWRWLHNGQYTNCYKDQGGKSDLGDDVHSWDVLKLGDFLIDGLQEKPTRTQLNHCWSDSRKHGHPLLLTMPSWEGHADCLPKGVQCLTRSPWLRVAAFSFFGRSTRDVFFFSPQEKVAADSVFGLPSLTLDAGRVRWVTGSGRPRGTWAMRSDLFLGEHRVENGLGWTWQRIPTGKHARISEQ